MEYCELGDLDEYLHKNNNLPFAKRLDIMYQTAQAVSYLHQGKTPIIHRDIKPENVLMKRENDVDIAKLTDFGFAKLYDYSLSVKGSTVYKQLHGTLRETPRYMAPEFFLLDEAELQYTASVDVFSLGLMCKVILDFSPENKSTFPLSGKFIDS